MVAPQQPTLRNPHYPSSSKDGLKAVLCEKHMLVAIFALSSNFLVTMLIVVVNKLLFTETRFPVITLSAAHMIVCVIFTSICSRLQIFERRKMDNKSVIALVAFLQSSAICLGQASLKMNSVAFFQLTKQMQVPLVAVVEYFFLSRTVSRDKIVLLASMVLGVSVACFNDVQFTSFGAIIAFVGVCATSVEVVLYSWLQQSHRWETLQLLHQTMPFAASGLTLAAVEVDFLQPRGMGAYNFVANFVSMFYVGNNEAIMNPEQFGEVGRMKATELAVDQSFFNIFEMSSYACFLFALSCALGMGVNVSSCFVGGKASALAYAMLGLTKTITVIAIGVLYFDAPPSYRVVFGGVFAVAAIVVYSIVTLREKQQQMNNSSKNAAAGAEMDVLLDEVEVGIEPATISPKMSNYSSKIKRGF
jgi:solute carrier family 35 protein E3